MSLFRSRSLAALLAAAATSFVLVAGAGADGGHDGDDDSSGPSGTTTQQDSSGRRGGEVRQRDDDRRHDDGDRRGHGRHGNRTILRSDLIGSQPGESLYGLPAGGAPWVVDESDVRLRRNGKLRLRVEGLVIPAPQGNGTAGGVTGIAASVVCDETVVATSKIVPLQQDGDARLRDKLTGVPARCLAPAVLVRPQVGGTLRDAFIAVTGG